MKRFKVKNWERFQHYKRRNPPWIRLHKSILNDHKLCKLSVASRLLAICLWLLASETDGEIAHDIEMVSFRVSLPEDVIADGFMELENAGFLIECLQHASNVNSTSSKVSHSVSELSELSEDRGVGEGDADIANEFWMQQRPAMQREPKEAVAEFFAEKLRQNPALTHQAVLVAIKMPNRDKTQKTWLFWKAHFEEASGRPSRPLPPQRKLPNSTAIRLKAEADYAEMESQGMDPAAIVDVLSQRLGEAMPSSILQRAKPKGPA